MSKFRLLHWSSLSFLRRAQIAAALTAAAITFGPYLMVLLGLHTDAYRLYDASGASGQLRHLLFHVCWPAVQMRDDVLLGFPEELKHWPSDNPRVLFWFPGPSALIFSVLVNAMLLSVFATFATWLCLKVRFLKRCAEAVGQRIGFSFVDAPRPPRTRKRWPIELRCALAGALTGGFLTYAAYRVPFLPTFLIAFYPPSLVVHNLHLPIRYSGSEAFALERSGIIFAAAFNAVLLSAVGAYVGLCVREFKKKPLVSFPNQDQQKTHGNSQRTSQSL